MNAHNPPLSPGLHRMPAEAYHADPCPAPSLSSSVAKLLLNRSPLHAWTASPRLNPDYEPQERKTFDIGRAAHRAVLGAGGDYVAYPAEMMASNGAASPTEAKAWAEERRAAGRTPLKADECDQIGHMADLCHHWLKDYRLTIDPARSEMVAIAEIDGCWCRAMIDNAPEDPRLPLIDFKTCEDASPDAVQRAVESYGYDLQAAHYLDVWKAATGEDRDFVFVFQEKEPPHGMAVVRLLNSAGHSGDWMEDAREKAHTARQTWAHCIANDHWPSYPAMIIEIGARGFHRQKWQDTRDRAASARAIAAAQKLGKEAKNV
jgi:hypothetical protein